MASCPLACPLQQPYLLNDRPCIQFTGGVVCSCANNLHAALMGPVVWLCPLKGWQEAVVDVDGAAPVTVAEVLTEDLHVPADAQQQGNSHVDLSAVHLERCCVRVHALWPAQGFGLAAADPNWPQHQHHATDT